MLAPTAAPCRIATSQCSMRCLPSTCGLTRLATSPAAQIQPLFVRPYASTTTPERQPMPACRASASLGTTPHPPPPPRRAPVPPRPCEPAVGPDPAPHDDRRSGQPLSAGQHHPVDLPPPGELSDRSAQPEPDAAILVQLPHPASRVGTEHREQRHRQQFDDGHVESAGAGDRRRLKPDEPRAHDDKRPARVEPRGDAGGVVGVSQGQHIAEMLTRYPEGAGGDAGREGGGGGGGAARPPPPPPPPPAA